MENWCSWAGGNTILGLDLLTSSLHAGRDSCRTTSCGTSEGSCFTALRQGEPWSYLRSTGCHRQSGGPGDVDRRIHVPVQPRHTHLTLPDTDTERLEAIIGTAGRAHLRGGLEPAYPVYLAAVQPTLILQHAHESRPPGIVNGLSQPGASEPRHCQVLHGDRLVVADQCRGEPVVEIAPRIGHPGMRSGNLDPSFVPVPAPLLLPQ